MQGSAIPGGRLRSILQLRERVGALCVGVTLALPVVTCGLEGCANDSARAPDVEAGGAQDAASATSPGMDAAADEQTQSDAPAAADGGTDADATTTDAAGVDAGEAQASDACSVSATGTAARSTGFSGSDTAYFALFDSVPCSAPADCVPSCVAAGGTATSCAMGSQCLSDLCPDGGESCVVCIPPTYWLDTQGALTQPGSKALRILRHFRDLCAPEICLSRGGNYPDAGGSRRWSTAGPPTHGARRGPHRILRCPVSASRSPRSFYPVPGTIRSRSTPCLSPLLMAGRPPVIE